MRYWQFAFGLLLLPIGCKADLEAPPKVQWGEEPCAHCRMLISDPRFAAALTLQNGEIRKYDDVGCLLKDYATHKAQVHRVWVRCYDSDKWLDAQQAWFVRSKGLHSPMASCIAAVQSKDAAERLASAVKRTVSHFDAVLNARD